MVCSTFYNVFYVLRTVRRAAEGEPPRLEGVGPGTSKNIYPACFHGESLSGFSTMRHIPQRMLRRQALQRTREWCPQEMTKVGDRAGPGTGGWDGTPRGRALSHGLLGKLNTWPSTVPPATPSLMKEQDEARGRRESQARARKADKRRDFRESPAEARKACKKRSFRAHEAEPRKARKTFAFSCSKEGK